MVLTTRIVAVGNHVLIGFCLLKDASCTYSIVTCEIKLTYLSRRALASAIRRVAKLCQAFWSI